MERAIGMSGWTGAIALLVTNVFAGKCDRPSFIPDAKPTIALWNKSKSAIAMSGDKVDRLFVIGQQGRSRFQINSTRPCISNGSTYSQIKIKPRTISPIERLFC